MDVIRVATGLLLDYANDTAALVLNSNKPTLRWRGRPNIA